MTVDDVRVRLRQKLEQSFGAEEASLLMDRPPGGWNDLVTIPVLDSKFAVLDARFDAIDTKFHAMDTKFDAIDTKFDAMDTKFDAIDTKFEAMDAKLEAMEARLRSDIHREIRDQTRWLANFVIAAQGVVVAVMAAIGAILRFA